MFSEAERALKHLDVELTGDLEMLNTIQSEVKRLCRKENVVSCILQRDRQEEYKKDLERMIAPDAITTRREETPQSDSERAVSGSSKRGWNPILAGFRARSALSEPSTPGLLMMERSRLPVDLNSATSEGSQRNKSDLDSEHSGSVRSKSRSTTMDEIESPVPETSSFMHRALHDV